MKLPRWLVGGRPLSYGKRGLGRRVVLSAVAFAAIVGLLGCLSSTVWAFNYPLSPSSYPLPPSDSAVIQTAIVSFSGPSSRTAAINVSATNPASPVTSLQFAFAENESSLTVDMYQLSAIPSSVSMPPPPAGKPSLLVFISVPPQVSDSIASVTLGFKLPLASLTAAKQPFTSDTFLVESVDLYTASSWTTHQGNLVGSDSSFVFLQTTSAGLSATLFDVSAPSTPSLSSSTATGGSASHSSITTTTLSTFSTGPSTSEIVMVVVSMAVIGSIGGFVLLRRRGSRDRLR